MSKQQHRHQFGSNYMHNAGIQHTKNSNQNNRQQLDGAGQNQRNSGGGGQMIAGATVGAVIGGALGGPAGMVVGALLGGFFSK